jgi:hypothetical protein
MFCLAFARLRGELTGSRSLSGCASVADATDSPPAAQPARDHWVPRSAIAWGNHGFGAIAYINNRSPDGKNALYG